MLKYYFTVLYKDGTKYEQNKQDVSLTDSKRSCFFDVKQDEVLEFMLSDETKDVIVDLEDGSFYINDIKFFMHDQGEGLKDFRLIFYRQHEHDFNLGMEEVAHRIKYCMGWQTNDKDGNNVKRIMEFT